MRYYKVKKEIQSAYLRKVRDYRTFVENELYTLAELKRLGVNPEWPNLEKVDVSRRKIYFFFGARFAL